MKTTAELLYRIRLLYDLKKYAEAIALFKENSPLMENRYALFYAGRSYLRIKKEELAVPLFYKALEIDPDYGAPKIELAKYYSKRDKEKAFALIDECIQHNPYEPAYWGILGSICFAHENFTRGEEAFEKFLSLAPNDPRSIANLAVCKDELGKHDEALPLYKKAISLAPNYINAHFNLAVHYSDGGKLEEAEKIYFEVLRMQPNSAAALYGLSCVYSLAGKTEKAFDFLQRSIDLDKKYKTYVLSDVDFDSLKTHPTFIEITA